MPIWDYRCANNHTHEQVRKYAERDECPKCPDCGADTVRLMPLPAKRTDGIYSYAENVGRPYEKRLQSIQDTGQP